MSKHVLLNACTWVGGHELTGDTNAVVIEHSSDMQDLTTFTHGSIQRIGGLKDVSISMDGYVDTDEQDGASFNKIDAQNVPVTVSPDGMVGEPAYFFNADFGQYNPGATIGEVLSFTFNGEASGGEGLIRGVLAHEGTESTSDTGAVYNLGNLAPDQALYASLHVLEVTGTNPTLDVEIESDSGVPYVVFPQFTNVGSKFGARFGETNEGSFRVKFTIGGTGVAFKFAVGLGITGFIGNKNGLSAKLDFTSSHKPLSAASYGDGDRFKFSRASSRWLKVYDTSSGTLVWREIGNNVVPIEGFYYADLNQNGSPTDANGQDVPSQFLGGYSYAPTQTNSIPDSRDFSAASWSDVGTITKSQDAVGFDGVANSAWTVTDSDSGALASTQDAITVGDDSNTHTALILVEKSADTSFFPGVRFRLFNGTAVNSWVTINKNTGNATALAGHSDGTVNVTSFDADFWLVEINITNNSTGNTLVNLILYPALSTTEGTSEQAATGSTIFDQAEIRLNTTFYDGIPITTSGSASTRLRDDYRLSIDNHSQIEGMLLLDWNPMIDKADLPGGTAHGLVSVINSSVSVQGINASVINANDGANIVSVATPAFVAGDSVQSATRWAGSELAVVLDGVSSVGSYDGGFLISGDDIFIGALSTFPFNVKSLHYYKKDKGTAWIQGQQV